MTGPFTDDLSEWERRPQTIGQPHWAREDDETGYTLLHAKREKCGNMRRLEDRIPASVVDALWDHGQTINPRSVGWCQSCAVKKV